MSKPAKLLIIIWSFAALAACSEKPQTIGSGIKQDAQAFQGTGVGTMTAAGWKTGDRGSWEQQMKTRTQMGQNDYNKVN